MSPLRGTLRDMATRPFGQSVNEQRANGALQALRRVKGISAALESLDSSELEALGAQLTNAIEQAARVPRSSRTQRSGTTRRTVHVLCPRPRAGSAGTERLTALGYFALAQLAGLEVASVRKAAARGVFSLDDFDSVVAYYVRAKWGVRLNGSPQRQSTSGDDRPPRRRTRNPRGGRS